MFYIHVQISTHISVYKQARVFDGASPPPPPPPPPYPPTPPTPTPLHPKHHTPPHAFLLRLPPPPPPTRICSPISAQKHEPALHQALV